MPGAVIRNPTPDWLKPENASVLDSPVTKAIRTLAHLIGADDPQSQVLGLMTPLVPEGQAMASKPVQKALKTLADLGEKVGIKAYHGSPNISLDRIASDPPSRQFDNGTSALGAFFSLDPSEAQRYAGKSGRVYEASLLLQRPYEMPYAEFQYLQDITRGPKTADPDFPYSLARPKASDWAARLQELKREGTMLRDRLTAAGHDGVIVRNSKGHIIEIASFADVPIAR